jgi:MotA/TolQ/ExbB proton channel family
LKINPAIIPTEISLDAREPSPRFGRVMAGVGVILFTGPIWGVFGTVFGMIQAFNRVSGGGNVASVELSNHVRFALTSMAVGIVVGLVGGAMILASILLTGYRKKWFYSWSFGLAIIWCIAVFPMGLIIGLPLISLLTTRRREFEKQEAEQNAPSDGDKHPV